MSTTSAPRPDSSISPARRASSAVAASRASTTSTATSQRSIWSRAIAADDVLVARVDRAAAAHARGVDQHVVAPAERERRVDRIAGGPGLRRGPGRAPRRAGSSPATTCRRWACRRTRSGSGASSSSRRGRRGAARRGRGAAASGRRATTRVEELADAAAVAGRHREDVGERRARRPRWRRRRALVSRPCSRRPAPACPTCAAAWRPRCRRRSPPRARRRRTRPRRPRRARAASAGASPPGCPSPSGSRPPVSTTRKRAGAPVADAVAAIAGHAGLVLDQRRLAADQAVEQRRLADVGSADQRDQRQLRRRRWDCVGAHARVSVQRERLGRGRPVGVRPSRAA